MTTIWERLLANCSEHSTVDREEHAARILTVVCAAKSSSAPIKPKGKAA